MELQNNHSLAATPVTVSEMKWVVVLLVVIQQYLEGLIRFRIQFCKCLKVSMCPELFATF